MDDIDRDQEFNEQQLEQLITQARSKVAALPSSHLCEQCNEVIPEQRRKIITGVTLCVYCQAKAERHR